MVSFHFTVITCDVKSSFDCQFTSCGDSVIVFTKIVVQACLGVVQVYNKAHNLRHLKDFNNELTSY
jgi:hypothetical protein